MVKAYLRYELADTWGVITSRAHVAYDKDGKYFFTASLERVAVWDVKQAVLLRTLDVSLSNQGGKKKRQVTCIVASPVANQIAVGYGDGSVRLWSTDSWDCECTLTGHSGAVTCLAYSESGEKVASGSQDTNIILWDVSGEVGLFKLKGHKGEVTGISFLYDKNSGNGASYVVSVSKDEFIKVWDLVAERCVQTVTSQGGEAWSVAYNRFTDRLVVGTSESNLRVFKVVFDQLPGILSAMGTVRRSTGDRVCTLEFANASASDSGKSMLICQGSGKVVDIWRIRTDSEAEKRKKRRKKRKEEKSNKKKKDEAVVAGDADKEDDELAKAGDELEMIQTIRIKHKISSFAYHPSFRSSKYLLRLVLALSNNSLEVWEVKENEEIVSSRVSTIDGPGHRSDVRSLALTSDDSICLSTSNAGAKIWNPMNGACVGSIQSGYGLCCLFAPGNKHAVIGTKEGVLEILDIGSCSRISALEAHGGPIWSIHAKPDGSGFVSGSADKTVKFWEWTLLESEDGSGGSQLSIDCYQTLEMPDDVLGVRFSPNGALLTVALLDTTVKVYFADTLKFFLSLYGHRLPVLTMDISSDSTLLVTGSADKNIKIWGLDYGDCHKSIFAHDDSVMAVAFVPGTHYLFSAGKDGVIKYWDADKFEHLLTLPNHLGEVWSLAVSSLGDFLISGSHDRSLRRWMKTEEAFFIEEEKEKRLESLFEEELETERKPLAEEENLEDGSSAVPGKKTLETVSAADSIVDALDMASTEEERIAEAIRDNKQDSLVANPLMLGLSPSEYVLRAIRSVRGSDLEQALLLVPFLDALRLLQFLCAWLNRGGDTELLSRVAILLCRVHLQQLMSTPTARPTLIELRELLHGRISDLKDTWGFNAAAIEFLKRQLHGKRSHDFLDHAASTAAKLKKLKDTSALS